jgi:hypothetical protein
MFAVLAGCWIRCRASLASILVNEKWRIIRFKVTLGACFFASQIVAWVTFNAPIETTSLAILPEPEVTLFALTISRIQVETVFAAQATERVVRIAHKAVLVIRAFTKTTRLGFLLVLAKLVRVLIALVALSFSAYLIRI